MGRWRASRRIFVYPYFSSWTIKREEKKKKRKKIDRETKTSSQRQLKRERKKKKLRKLGTDAKTL